MTKWNFYYGKLEMFVCNMLQLKKIQSFCQNSEHTTCNVKIQYRCVCLCVCAFFFFFSWYHVQSIVLFHRLIWVEPFDRCQCFSMLFFLVFIIIFFIHMNFTMHSNFSNLDDLNRTLRYSMYLGILWKQIKQNPGKKTMLITIILC